MTQSNPHKKNRQTLNSPPRAVFFFLFPAGEILIQTSHIHVIAPKPEVFYLCRVFGSTESNPTTRL